MQFVEISNWTEEQYLAIMKRACQGNREALEWVMRQEAPWILSVVRGFAQGSTGGATPEDSVQDCWVAFMESADDLNFKTRGAFRAWLRMVARNQWIRGQRRRRETPELPEVIESAPWQAPEATPSPKHWLSSARKELPFRQGAVLFLRDGCGCSYEVISLLLNCKSANSARGLRSRALLGLSGRVVGGVGVRVAECSAVAATEKPTDSERLGHSR